MNGAAAPLAFIGTMELVLIVVVGLLLFGGDLPKVLGEMGRMWVKLRRAVNEFKRESGIDEAVRDLKRETDFRLEEPRWRRDMDHSAGPARSAPAQDGELEDAGAPKSATEAESDAAGETASASKPQVEPERPRPPDTGPSE